jgi:hypothetical protein
MEHHIQIGVVDIQTDVAMVPHHPPTQKKAACRTYGKLVAQPSAKPFHNEGIRGDENDFHGSVA